MSILYGKTILIIDDDAAIRALVALILRKDGANAVEAGSGAEAEACLAGGLFDAILLDVRLPDVDGYDLCRRLVSEMPKTPVLMITALTEDESLRRGFEAGAADYIKKPLSRVELLSRLQKSLRLRDSEARYDALYSSLLEDLETAAKTQALSLPKGLQAEEGALFASFYQPSRQVGGDLFDIIPLGGGRFVLYIADISGHGIHCALLMSAVKAYLTMIVENRSVPDEPLAILNRLSRTLTGTLMRDKYLTILLGVLDVPGRRFRYLNAGHPPGILYDPASGRATLFGGTAGGIPVGWKQNQVYAADEEQTLELPDQTRLIFCTDGVLEAADATGRELGVAGFAALIERLGPQPFPALPSLVYETLRDGGFFLAADDLTILAAEPESASGLNLAVPPALPNVAAVLGRIESEILEKTSDSLLASKAELAAAEILNNIIQHGGLDPDGNPVLIQVGRDEKDSLLRFYDFGAPWTLPEPGPDEDFRTDQARGRGLSILRTLCASVDVRRIGPLNETILRLTPEPLP